MGNLQEAELSTRKAIELNPDFPEAHYNLGNILNDLSNLKDAELSYRKAIELNPDFPDAYANLGFILLFKGEYNLSLKYYSIYVELNRREDSNKESNHSRFKLISQYKMNHDIEQFEYLVSQGYQNEKFTKLAILYKQCASEINWPSETKLISLSDEYQRILNGTYNRLIHKLEAPRLKNEAVNNSLNIESITNDYFNHKFGLVYIDNFLSPLALESLREFLLGSTIWFNVANKGGYLGTNLKEGLGNPLIFQIAEELRKKFPKIFKDHPIKQIWAYKYDSRAKNKSSDLSGIHPHADDGAITFNLWITPSDANLNPSSGGLVFHSLEAPKQWDYNYQNSYNHDMVKIQEELKKSKDKTEVIPYKENRAVIFNSHLFHETDNYEFKDGYQNRRINLGILFD
jgi:tetratricopeptide (TPR) repeat protein